MTNQVDDTGTSRAWAATRDLALSAWDLARLRGGQTADSGRSRLVTLRAHRRLQASYEAQRGIATPDRSLLLINDEAQDACLLLPGPDASPAELTPLAHHLHRNGLTVLVKNLVDAAGEEGDVQKPVWRANLLVARKAYQMLAQVHRRVHVVGYSLGSSLAVLLARREPVSRLVLLAPALLPQVSLAQKLLLALKLHRLSWLRSRLDWDVDLLEGMDQARSSVGRLRMPIYAAQCDDDERIAPDSLRHVQKKARNQTSRFQVFPTGGHAILATHGDEVLHDEIARFLTDDR